MSRYLLGDVVQKLVHVPSVSLLGAMTNCLRVTITLLYGI